MNPLTWPAKRIVALIVISALGGLAGLLLSMILIAPDHAGVMGTYFSETVANPILYWPLPMFGTCLAALGFYFSQLLRD